MNICRERVETHLTSPAHKINWVFYIKCHMINMLEPCWSFQQLSLHQHVSYAGWVSAGRPRLCPPPKSTVGHHSTSVRPQWPNCDDDVIKKSTVPHNWLAYEYSCCPARASVSPPPLWHNTATPTSHSAENTEAVVIFFMTSFSFPVTFFFQTALKAFTPDLCI